MAKKNGGGEGMTRAFISVWLFFFFSFVFLLSFESHYIASSAQHYTLEALINCKEYFNPHEQLYLILISR